MIILIALLHFTPHIRAQAIVTYEESSARKADITHLPQRSEYTVSLDEARRVALAFLNIHPAFIRGMFDAKDALMDIRDVSDTRTLAYVLELQSTGFIVVTGDKEIGPLLAYSNKSKFDAKESTENILLQMIRGDVSLRLLALQENVISSTVRARSQSSWNTLTDKTVKQTNQGIPNQRLLSDFEYGPYLTSEWSQSNAYDNNWNYRAVWNYYTPKGPDGSTSNYVCGCVATAMAQILNFHEWPITGTGSYSYTWYNGSNPEELSVDFSSPYDWANTLDIYYYVPSTLQQRQAAGLLSYHCGVSVDMNYTSSGSGAFTFMVNNALKDRFRTSGNYLDEPETDFWSRLNANMISGRPGELSISRWVGGTRQSGHAVVIDGLRYDAGDPQSEYEYHLNMGWGGSSDAWYVLPNITSSPYYNQVDGCVMDIIPTPDLDDPGITTTSTDIPLSWQVSSTLNAANYEVQQLAIPSTLDTYSDDIEGGMGNWTVEGHWSTSTSYSQSPSHSIHGELYKNFTWSFPGTCTLNSTVKIDALTTITYYYWLNNFNNYQARFEIAEKGTNWTTLKTYTSSTTVGPVLETITTSDLSDYVGKVVALRFVITYLGGSISYGTPGFYFDDFTLNTCSMSNSWVSLNDNITTESYTSTVSAEGDYAYRVRAYADGGRRDWSDIEHIVVDFPDPPTTQATNVECNGGGDDPLLISWTRGDGDGCIVFMRQGNTGEASPEDNVYYTADAVFGDGDQIGSTGWHCVYDGDGSSVTVTGLTPSADYRIHVCEYNLGSITYNTGSSAGNPATEQNPIAVELTSFTALLENGFVRLEWETASEIDVAGFNILTAVEKDGIYTKCNRSMILASGSAARNKVYHCIIETELIRERWYKLQIVNLDGVQHVSHPISISSATLVESNSIPKKFALYQNYPNPFNPQTTIRFDLPRATEVTLVIYDMQGRLVRTLLNGQLSVGAHELIWDGTDDFGISVSSGLYFYSIQAGKFFDLRKLTLLK